MAIERKHTSKASSGRKADPPRREDRDGDRAGGKAATAIEREVEHLVDALDARHSRRGDEGSKTGAGTLGGPGNFGGGNLENKDDEER